MDKDKKNINLLSKPNAKLRISKNKFPVEDPKVKEALDKALAKQRLSNELENLRNTVGCQTRSSEIDWTSKFKTLESPSDPKLQPRRENDSRRNTFEVLHPSNIPVHQEHFSPFDNSHHKRQQSPSSSTDHLPVKKVCTNEAAVHQDSLEVALKKIQQQVLLSENDGKVPDLIRSLKPDAFNIMNTIKMKIITSNKRDKSAEKREWLRKKVVASLPSDDTDAPSIVSMEEDRSILPDPLRLSDLQLPISNRSTSIYGSLPCSSPSLNKSTDQSMVTSSSFGCNASPPPPLVVPKSVQRLKLKSSFSQSDLIYSPIPQLRRSKKPMQHESDMENSLSFTTNIRYGPRYSSSSSVHTEEKNVFNPKMQPQLHEREPQSPSRRVQIDQVKLKPLRSASATSVVETTSSSESSVVTQSYDEKKRYDVEDKTMILNQKKLEKELIKRLQKKVLKIHELDKYEQLMKLGRSRRDKSTSPLESIITRDVACLVKEDNDSAPSEIVASSLHSVEEARATDLYNSESFESPESSETPRQPVMIHRPAVERKPFVTARFNKSKVLIKVPLSPRVQMRSKRNCSSGSDESLVLSHNETQSEQSDLEVKISALKEQKRQRYAELSRLQRELKRAQRDQMKATEDALIKQIAVYDSYIAQTKKQLEEVTATTAVKPQIKHPRVSDKFLPSNADVTNKTQKAEDQTKQQEHIASDIETNSMKSISEASSIENTILSSGHTHVTEKVSPISEILSAQGSISTHNKNEEAEIISAVVTDESIVSQQSKTDSSIPTHLESENDVANESQWMDAEEFFNELGHPDTSSFINPVENKVESKETLSSVSTEAVSEALTNTSSSVPDSSDNQTKLEVEGESQSLQSEDADDTSLVKECITSEPEHIGSMDSIVSEVPTHSATNSSISKEKDDLDGAVISPPHVPVSVKDSSISSISENGLNNSGKLYIDEGAAQEDNVSNESIPYSLNNSSLNNSEEIADECDDQPSPDENLESTKSDLIKVFVSNKNKTSIINTDEMITESKIVDKPQDKQVSLKNKVDKITDEILKNLVNECLSERKTQHNALNNNKLVVAETNSTYLTQTELLSKNEQLAKEFSNDIVNKYIVEATEAVLKIMDSKKMIDGENNKIDVNSNGLTSNQEDSTDMLKEHEKPSLATKPNLSTEEETNDGEVFWFDEDLHPVSLQTQLEAEELRRKQLQIEQEIKQLEQAQETIPSYYYVREIPNKPPPPYTPPGQTATQPKDQHDPVPKKREEVERLVSAAVQQLFVAYSSGEDLSTVQPSSQYFSSQTGNRVYKKFLFDLAKQIFVDLTSNVSNEKDIPPWEKTGSRIKYLVLPKLTEDFISNYILKKIRILFGFEMDSIKENLIIQWSRKKRDRVDELLVRESQEEEQEWTDYSSCEVAVKNSVTMGILDSLVGDTALAFSKAWKKKLEYCERNS